MIVADFNIPFSIMGKTTLQKIDQQGNRRLGEYYKPARLNRYTYRTLHPTAHSCVTPNITLPRNSIPACIPKRNANTFTKKLTHECAQQHICNRQNTETIQVSINCWVNNSVVYNRILFSNWKNEILPWLVWLSRLSASLRNKELPVRFPVTAHTSRGRSKRQPHFDVSLSLFLLPLSKNK